MDILSAFILGIVEGLTEFLPVSSTGHLVMASSLLGLAQTEFVKSFEIAIQLGAVCAVLWESKRAFVDKRILPRVVAAFIPTALIGLLAYETAKEYLLGNELVTVIALGIGGVLLIVFERWHLKNATPVTPATPVIPAQAGIQETAPEPAPEPSVASLTYAQAVAIGIGQSLAIIPGVSRSAASIVTGLGIGLSRTVAVEFSFLLAVPTIAAAVALDVLKGGFSPTADELVPLAVGFFTAALIAWFTMRFLLQYVRTNTFVPFGVYRIVAAVAYWWLVL